MPVYFSFSSWHLKRIAEKERHFDSLPPNHRLLLKKFGDHFNMVRECILYNAEFIDEMILEAERMFLNEDYQCKTEAAEPVRPADMDKVDSTMVQLVRDWSGAGSEERKASYGMVVQALEEEFSDLLPEERSETRVLVPGAGLGRLAFEIFRRGFSSEGNEYSMFMLVAANFMINRILKPGGIWINIGPLLYHYADMKDNLSIEPPYDILKECIVAIGFKFEKEEVNVETPYACDMNSMNKNTFRSVFFVCRKPTNFEQS
ncbi:unnamed protein product [Notodromas monacha]|uniref:carnosine N-methyltransferase n=1 Tax=Notodromas monacha TaxID=399045 RepID=A0A7R9C1P4_9CRUS|nr:unnamed protein product [Notodromas monacha]CAG0925299.1 unnamed protein product [Notodromas monacha]